MFNMIYEFSMITFWLAVLYDKNHTFYLILSTLWNIMKKTKKKKQLDIISYLFKDKRLNLMLCLWSVSQDSLLIVELIEHFTQNTGKM